MRIVAKIAAAGVSSLSRFPVLQASIDECLNDSGRLDEQKARHALECDQVTFASKDDRRVIAFAMEYLTQLESVVKHLTDNLNAQGEADAQLKEVQTDGAPPPPNFRSTAAIPLDRRCERNMKKGRYAFVRTDITSCADGIHVKLSVQNPKGIVGNAERFARGSAVMFARILLYLRASITTAPIVLIEGDGASGIFAEAADLDRQCDLEKKRRSCPSLHNGFCSPATSSCPLYQNGRCREP